MGSKSCKVILRRVVRKNIRTNKCVSCPKYLLVPVLIYLKKSKQRLIETFIFSFGSVDTLPAIQTKSKVDDVIFVQD